jgi:TolB protein
MIEVDADPPTTQKVQFTAEATSEAPTQTPEAPTQTPQVPTMTPEAPPLTPVGQGAQSEPLLEFEALLTQAIETHDFAKMQSLMGDSFALAFWQSEGLTISPSEAIEQLRLNYLLAGNTIRFQEGPDLSPQLGGNDILSIWDPAVKPVRALYGLGWGANGNDEAFLIIAQRPDGTLYWYAMLMTEPGFADRAVEHPVNDPSVRISPLSGPPGTLVQVIASDFGAYAPLSVAVGPENSEFSEVAHGRANADGVYIVQIPAQGGAGMRLVFGVRAEGRPGVFASDRFHITAAPEPRVTIWPLSGSSGSLVQVTASGFPPNTPVTVGVGPANSQFSQAAQGTTDAHGGFVVHVPVQGEAGMRFVFAVAAAGQPGVTAPELFHITEPIATVIPTPVPVITPTPTPYLDMWTTFSSVTYAISLEYPADWQPVPGYGDPETDEARYGAINGFFQISAMDSDSIDKAAAAEAEHKLQPYGSKPTIETLQIQGQEARLILPSDDQPKGMQHQAALIVRYPEPVNITGTPCRYFVLWADWPHIRTIGQTLQFAR